MRQDNVGLTVARRSLWVILRSMVVAALVFCLADPASAQYEIDWFRVAGGAAKLSAGSYALEGTTGQPEAGLMTGGGYSLVGGFWGGSSGGVVGVSDNFGDQIPQVFQLHAAAPNPFIQRSLIVFDLPHPQFTRLRVFDTAGRLVRTLANEMLPAGCHQRVWDATSDAGRPVGVGIYFVQCDGEGFEAKQKVIILK